MKVDFAQMKQFLIERYKHDRLYGRTFPGCEYGDVVVEGAIKDLTEYGIGCISRHESITGREVWYNTQDGLIQEIDRALARAALRQDSHRIAANVAT